LRGGRDRRWEVLRGKERKSASQDGETAKRIKEDARSFEYRKKKYKTCPSVKKGGLVFKRGKRPC